MLKRYVSKYPSLSMTALKEDGNLTNIKFENGVFETEDPKLQETIENNQYFNGSIWLADSPGAPEQPKEKRSYHYNYYDPIAEVLAQEAKAKEAENAEKAGAEAPKKSKKKGSKGKE